MTARAFQKNVLTAISRHGLLPRGAAIVVAVSGGPDSMALLDALRCLAPTRSWSLTVAHVRYGLRGAAAGHDRDLVVAYCDRHAIPCHVRDLSGTTHPADEAWLRQVRYAFLEEVRIASGSDHIAVGHTRDDQAETVLLHLLRGTGLSGLSGMRPCTGMIVRPLLDIARAATHAYCTDAGITVATDSTNTDTAYLRNRIRHELIPFLEDRFNPSITDTLVRTATTVADDLAALEDLSTSHVPSYTTSDDGTLLLSAAALATLPPAIQRLTLRRALAHLGIPDQTLGTIESLRVACCSTKPKSQTVTTAALSLTRNGDTVILAAGPRR